MKNNNPTDIEEKLPNGISREQVLTKDEFEKYKKDKKPFIEEILENVDIHGYKYYTILFLNDTADEVFVKITE